MYPAQLWSAVELYPSSTKVRHCVVLHALTGVADDLHLHPACPQAHDSAVDRTITPEQFSSTVAEQPTFAYAHAGSFAYIGGNQALAQIPSGTPDEEYKLEGQAVYFAWRTVYFSKLLR